MISREEILQRQGELLNKIDTLTIKESLNNAADKSTILAENENSILVKVEGCIRIGSISRKALRYEIWSEKEKFIQGIRSDGKYIYCSGFTGVDENDMIKIFEKNRGNIDDKKQ